jgi:RNA-directed DNA polymerase
MLARELSEAFLAGPWNETELAERGAGWLDRWPSWMAALAMHVCAVHRAGPPSTPQARVALRRLIATFLAERAAQPGEATPPSILPWTEFTRPVLRHDWPIAEIDSVATLAERLELDDGQLAWLADVRGLERTVTAPKLRNYRYATVPRRTGPPRVIEMPKARLKEIQRWILREILDHVPPHAAAHGFTRGRSVRTHAELHTGQAVVLRFDLKDFFASVSAGRVYGIFLTVGYKPEVAHVLTGLTTNAVPSAVWQSVPAARSGDQVSARFWFGRQLATPHLPQGAPTSPALANLAAFRLDRRLAGLAAAAGLNYSRYADDLTFSGPQRRRDRLPALVASIVSDAGFALNHAKTRRMSRAQRQSVCGVVVNIRPNVTRREYDQLRAILSHAARDGPAATNRAGTDDFAAHLRGRIAWVASLNPGRGEKLGRAFAAIDWGDPEPDAGDAIGPS